MEINEFRNNLVADIAKRFRYSSSSKEALRKLIIEYYDFIRPSLIKTTECMDSFRFDFPNFDIVIHLSYEKSIYQNIGKDYDTGESIVLSTNDLYKIVEVR